MVVVFNNILQCHQNAQCQLFWPAYAIFVHTGHRKQVRLAIIIIIFNYILII